MESNLYADTNFSMKMGERTSKRDSSRRDTTFHPLGTIRVKGAADDSGSTLGSWRGKRLPAHGSDGQTDGGARDACLPEPSLNGYKVGVVKFVKTRC